MSYSNQTPNLGLPQWTGSDKPTYLVDQNGAYDKIDQFAGDTEDSLTQLENDLDALAGRVTTAEGKQATDETNISGLQSQVGLLQTTVARFGASITNLTHDVNTAQSDIDTVEGAVNTLTGTTIPAMQTQADNTAMQLTTTGTASGAKFYFDYQGGKFGFNTSAARGADTFNPFNAGGAAMTTEGFQPLFLKLKYFDLITQSNSAETAGFVNISNCAIKIALSEIISSLNEIYGVIKTSTDITNFLTDIKNMYDTLSADPELNTSDVFRGFELFNIPVRIKTSVSMAANKGNAYGFANSVGTSKYGKATPYTKGAAIIDNALIMPLPTLDIAINSNIASGDYEAITTPIAYSDNIGNTDTTYTYNYTTPIPGTDYSALDSFGYIMPIPNISSSSHIYVNPWFPAARDMWNQAVSRLIS